MNKLWEGNVTATATLIWHLLYFCIHLYTISYCTSKCPAATAFSSWCKYPCDTAKSVQCNGGTWVSTFTLFKYCKYIFEVHHFYITRVFPLSAWLSFIGKYILLTPQHLFETLYKVTNGHLVLAAKAVHRVSFKHQCKQPTSLRQNKSFKRSNQKPEGDAANATSMFFSSFWLI